ncbi:MAG: peptidoglycan-associated lipoprotein Pal [Alphaproteobacteria bacterium]
MNFYLKALSIAALSLLLGACTCCKKKDAMHHSHGPNYEACKGRMSKAGYLVDKDGNHLVLDREFYAFDSSDLTDESKATLKDQKDWMSNNPDFSTTIAGHCDERGTREYNIGLGERRANAAKEYLVMSGVDSSRISVVSKGKDEPIVTGSTEEAWAQNRVAITSKN